MLADMKRWFMARLVETRTLLGALVDKQAWILVVPVMLTLYTVDGAMVKTLVQWTMMGAALTGFAIVLSRIVFYKIRIDELMVQVREGSTPAAIVVAGLMVFVAVLILALALWAKP